jgi:hypothetical protein
MAIKSEKKENNMLCKNAELYKQQLIELANNCELSVPLAYFITKDFFRDVEALYLDTLKKESDTTSLEKEERMIFDPVTGEVEKEEVKHETE